MNTCEFVALSVDAAAFVQCQSASRPLAAADRAATPISGPSHFGRTAGGGGAIEANNYFSCWRRPLDHKWFCAADCLCDQFVCYALAVCRREAEIAHLALVHACMGKVCHGSAQDVVLHCETYDAIVVIGAGV